MNDKLKQALEIYRKLGYEETAFEDIIELGTGSAEEKKLAKQGLSSGEWWEFRQIGENTYGSVNVVGADTDKLAIFAIKVGVDARRAANVLSRNGEVALQVISERGEKYALNFINAACRPNRRVHEHSPSVFGELCVHLVHTMDLPIPESVDYIKDWAFYAEKAFEKDDSTRVESKDDFDPPIEMIRRRFSEHIEVGVAVNAPATGPFSKVLLQGVHDGLISNGKAKHFVFFALDKSSRPGDRKEWMRTMEELGVTDEELLGRAESLIPLLALGETAITERIVPVLLPKISEERFPEVLMSSFVVKSKKMKAAILKIALLRELSAPSEELREWLTFVKADADKSLHSKIDALAKKWKFVVEAEEEPEEQPTGLWQSTPSVRKVPRFQLREVTSEHLTELASELSRRKSDVPDLRTEEFIAMANALALQDAEEVKLCLTGLTGRDSMLIHVLGAWARNRDIQYFPDAIRRRETTAKNYSGLFIARDFVVASHIDRLPCVLSSPSFEDLSISVSDLAERLERVYGSGIGYVFEADLQLALTRLDVDSVVEEAVEIIRNCPLEIIFPDGEAIRTEEGKPLLVSEVVPAYFEDPYVEPVFEDTDVSFWNLSIEMPKSLRYFPNRFNWGYEKFYAMFPLWGDSAMASVRRDTEVYHGQGLVLRQVARRRMPLPKGAAMNFLAAASTLSEENAEDVITAIGEAWQRGLLRPKVAEVSCLDWRGEIRNLAALAQGLEIAVEQGALAVVWQILDELVRASSEAPRMIAGTAEVVKLIEKYLSEVFLAVENGLATEAELDLPGVRILAEKKGSSLAIREAKEVVRRISEFVRSNLSKGTTQEKVEKKPRSETVGRKIPVPKIPFEEGWRMPPTPKPILEDGVEMNIELLETKRSFRLFVFSLQLPDERELEYKVTVDWTYGLEAEGQTRAYRVPVNTPNNSEAWKNAEQVWIYWDSEERKVRTSTHRNRADREKGPLSKGHETPLPISLLTVILGLAAQDGDMIYAAPRLIRSLVESGTISEEVTVRAMRTLLRNDAVSPAKLVRILEKEPDLLPVLWRMLKECVREGGERTMKTGKSPAWVNRVLDITLYHAHYLKEAGKRGWIPFEMWTGLSEIANSKAKSTAKEKAKCLMDFWKE